MSYTSPSPALVAHNGNQTTWWIPATNYGTTTGTGVTVSILFEPALSLGLVTYVAPTGTSYSTGTGIWNIGTLAPGTANTKWLKIVTSVVDIGLAPFTLTSVISGNGIDPNNVNNELVQTLESTVCVPSAGAVADPNGCFCGNVSTNDTICSHGVTEYRVTPGSIINSTDYTFNVDTGEYQFIPDNITLDITFTYSIWCDTGGGFLQTSGPVTVTIPAIVTDITPFDHTINTVEFGDLSVDDIATLTAQYPALTLADYCWRVLRNAEGVATSGEPVDCNDTQDTRTIHLCSAVDCEDIVNNCPLCPQNQLPADIQILLDAIILADEYEVELGDTIVVQHPNAQSTYVYGALGWERNDCGCVYKISQDADNLLILGTDDAPYISLVEIGAVVGDDWGVEVIHHTVDSISTGDGTLLDPLYVPPTEVTVTDTSDINLTIVGDGIMSPFSISGEVNEGDPLPVYDTGVLGSVTNSVPLASLFADVCPAGFATPTYTVVSYPTDVYDNVGILGADLIYNILSTAPSGTHYINVARTCAP